jgi:hypothetical protein
MKRYGLCSSPVVLQWAVWQLQLPVHTLAVGSANVLVPEVADTADVAPYCVVYPCVLAPIIAVLVPPKVLAWFGEPAPPHEVNELGAPEAYPVCPVGCP